DMFLTHYLLAGKPAEFHEPLIRMAEYLDSLTGTGRSIPLIGDDDGGRLFHPYGIRREFCCATLATCGVLFDRPEWIRDPNDLDEQAVWWLGDKALSPIPSAKVVRASRLFASSGLAIMHCHEPNHDMQVIADMGPFGPWGAGHSHADTLQVLVRANGKD